MILVAEPKKAAPAAVKVEAPKPVKTKDAGKATKDKALKVSLQIITAFKYKDHILPGIGFPL